ncbi:hypothetical protein A2335_02970 [Candidatus Peregrinibacteria bacterium RIFOXYB2_FULL_32_7]|nr:MAG: hypothetical protein A2335_02970 [Candidatus Peregrinibacteria bacterium RIFOXYB2_FULL_32_7]OGY87421.1 MAG: hypothetical protein A2233_00705 [Candidatus Kerfeldbacteria bacterium RIFOXYA2_FULL_38_24]
MNKDKNTIELLDESFFDSLLYIEKLKVGKYIIHNSGENSPLCRDGSLFSNLISHLIYLQKYQYCSVESISLDKKGNYLDPLLKSFFNGSVKKLPTEFDCIDSNGDIKISKIDNFYTLLSNCFGGGDLLYDFYENTKIEIKISENNKQRASDYLHNYIESVLATPIWLCQKKKYDTRKFSVLIEEILHENIDESIGYPQTFTLPQGEFSKRLINVCLFNHQKQADLFLDDYVDSQYIFFMFCIFVEKNFNEYLRIKKSDNNEFIQIYVDKKINSKESHHNKNAIVIDTYGGVKYANYAPLDDFTHSSPAHIVFRKIFLDGGNFEITNIDAYEAVHGSGREPTSRFLYDKIRTINEIIENNFGLSDFLILADLKQKVYLNPLYRSKIIVEKS